MTSATIYYALITERAFVAIIFLSRFAGEGGGKKLF